MNLVISVLTCQKCAPVYQTDPAPSFEGVYKCNCGNEFDIPTGKYLNKKAKCPEYFKFIPTGKVYACVGNDDGYFWAQDDNNQFGQLKFEQSECEIQSRS